MCVVCAFLYVPSSARLPTTGNPYPNYPFQPYQKQPDLIEDDAWRDRHDVATLVMGAIISGLDLGTGISIILLHWGQPLHVWILSVLASFVEAAFVIAANVAVEFNMCKTSHVDLDDTLPFLWAATFGVQVVYFIGVWVSQDVSADSISLAFVTGLWVLTQFIGLGYLLIAKLKTILLLGTNSLPKPFVAPPPYDGQRYSYPAAKSMVVPGPRPLKNA